MCTEQTRLCKEYLLRHCLENICADELIAGAVAHVREQLSCVNFTEQDVLLTIHLDLEYHGKSSEIFRSVSVLEVPKDQRFSENPINEY